MPTRFDPALRTTAVEGATGYFSVGVASVRRYGTVTVDASGTLSGQLDCGESGVLCGLEFSGGLGTAATGGTIYPWASASSPTKRLQDSTGSDIPVVFYTGEAFSLEASQTNPWRYWKFEVSPAPGVAGTIVAVITDM